MADNSNDKQSDQPQQPERIFAVNDSSAFQSFKGGAFRVDPPQGVDISNLAPPSSPPPPPPPAPPANDSNTQ